MEKPLCAQGYDDGILGAEILAVDVNGSGGRLHGGCW